MPFFRNRHTEQRNGFGIVQNLSHCGVRGLTNGALLRENIETYLSGHPCRSLRLHVTSGCGPLNPLTRGHTACSLAYTLKGTLRSVLTFDSLFWSSWAGKCHQILADDGEYEEFIMTPEEKMARMTKAINQAIKVMGDRFGSTEEDVVRAIQELKASLQPAS